jgi:hypothetical protein
MCTSAGNRLGEEPDCAGEGDQGLDDEDQHRERRHEGRDLRAPDVVWRPDPARPDDAVAEEFERVGEGHDLGHVAERLVGNGAYPK